jgi:hypothetical protein
MLRPLAVDVLELLVPLSIGGLLFLVGRKAHGWPRWARGALIALAVGVVAIWASTLADVFTFEIRALFSWLGGGKVALSWSALLLLGFAWGSPRRSFTPPFLLFLAGVAGLLIAIEASASLWWRWADTHSWSQTVNDRGGLRQSSGKTCGPASAAMFLHHYGISSSEGELAYLSRTSWFGTDCYDLSRALQSKVKSAGWTVHVGKPGYDALADAKTPFIAQVRRPGLGYHASSRNTRRNNSSIRSTEIRSGSIVFLFAQISANR